MPAKGQPSPVRGKTLPEYRLSKGFDPKHRIGRPYAKRLPQEIVVQRSLDEIRTDLAAQLTEIIRFWDAILGRSPEITPEASEPPRPQQD